MNESHRKIYKNSYLSQSICKSLNKSCSCSVFLVLKLRGRKLELWLLEIAQKEEVDEFIIGLPKSRDGEETPQSNKVRSVAGRLAVRATERGWRVYLRDEHGTSAEAVDRMISLGLSKSARQTRTDAYAAVIVQERFFFHVRPGNRNRTAQADGSARKT